MKAAEIDGATRILGAPKGWNRDRDGACEGLPIREARLESGQPVMISAWKPTPDELDRLNRGAAIELGVCGIVHPPVFMGVGTAPPGSKGEVPLTADQVKAIQIGFAVVDESHSATNWAETNAATIRDGDGPGEGTRCPECHLTNGHLSECKGGGK